MKKDVIDSDIKPRVWIYNIGADKIWEPSKMGINKVSNEQERQILNRLSEMMIFLTKETDTLYLVTIPDEEFVKDMELLGVKQPKIRLLPPDLPCHFTEFIANSEACRKELIMDKDNNGDTLYIPYIVTKQDESICKDLGLTMWGPKADTTEKVNSKVFARRIACGLGYPTTEGYICSCKNELVEGYSALQKRGYKHCVIKEPYGTSGKAVHFIKDEKTFTSIIRMIRFPEKNKKFEVILEGWIENKIDINYQIAITSNGNVKLLTINEQLINKTTYKGTRFPAKISVQQYQYFQRAAEVIGKRLYQHGYTGVMGIDAIVKSSGEIIPIIEFNGRFNQSTFYIPIFSYLTEWKRQTVIKYYDIRTSEYLDYHRLKEHISMNGQAFSGEVKTGILVLNSSCLSYGYDETDKRYLSRVFIAMVTEEGKNTHEEIEIADNLIKKIQK